MKNEAGGGGSLQGNELKLDDQCLSSLPGWVVETPRHAAVLKILYLNKNQFTRLPALLGLPHLEKLNMAGNSLSVIHAGVLPPSLLVLELINNQITTIEPGAFAALRKLRHLDLGANLLAGEALDGAAAELAGCRDLAVVDISCNRVRALPPSLVALAAAVQELRLSCNDLGGGGGAPKLHSSKSLGVVTLARCGLASLPGELVQMPALRVLDAGRNRLAALPDAFKQGVLQACRSGLRAHALGSCAPPHPPIPLVHVAGAPPRAQRSHRVAAVAREAFALVRFTHTRLPCYQRHTLR